MIRMTIPGRLPGLNEYIEACRNSKFEGNKLKSGVENHIIRCIKSQLRGVQFKKPVVMNYTWVEPNRRRDKDNIAFARKFVQDALVKAKVLKNDGWAYIENFTDDFAVDAKHPRVEITFQEVGIRNTEK